MMKYEVYKTETGRTYVAVSKKFDKETAIKIANEHFKVKKSDLICEVGRTLGDEDLIVPHKTGDVWAISRKGIEG